MSKSSGIRYCSVPMCSNTAKNKNVSFHHFPLVSPKWPKEKNDRFLKYQQQWIYKLRIGKKVTKNMYVCSEHFVEFDFFRCTPGNGKKRHRLKENAIPSVKLPSSLKKMHLHSSKKKKESEEWNAPIIRFPFDEEKRKDREMQLKQKNFKASKHSRICSKNFTDDSFARAKFGGSWLKSDALPTLFDFPDNLQEKIKEGKLAKKHSLSSQNESEDSTGKRRLKENAVPTLNLPRWSSESQKLNLWGGPKTSKKEKNEKISDLESQHHSNQSTPAHMQSSKGSFDVHSPCSTLQVSEPVRFNRAIDYVSKIKNRFQAQPDIYKEFLAILQTSCKGKRNLKDGVHTVSKPLTEAEVYAKVAKLFRNQDDLLLEFRQFIPDVTSVLVDLEQNNKEKKNSPTNNEKEITPIANKDMHEKVSPTKKGMKEKFIEIKPDVFPATISSNFSPSSDETIGSPYIQTDTNVLPVSREVNSDTSSDNEETDFLSTNEPAVLKRKLQKMSSHNKKLKMRLKESQRLCKLYTKENAGLREVLDSLRQIISVSNDDN